MKPEAIFRADIGAPELVETRAFVKCGEADPRTRSRLADIGTGLAEATGGHAGSMLGADVEKQPVNPRGRRNNDSALTGYVAPIPTDAFTLMYGDGENENDKSDAARREIQDDKGVLLDELETFRDALTPIVAETVGPLGVALRLPARAGIKKRATWLMKRTTGACRTFAKRARRKLIDSRHRGGFVQAS